MDGDDEDRLFRQPKSRRRKPFVDVGGYFGLPGSADDFVPSCARWKQFGFGSQALCFFGKAGFEGFSFLKRRCNMTHLLHTGPNRRVLQFQS
jgi:hypothetical protein